MKKFPKTIYVTREDEGTTDEYFNAFQTIEERTFEETQVTARYELVEVGKVIVSREYSNGKSGR